VAAYYAANQPLFTAACISRIVVATEAKANQLVTQLNGGASFADLAKADSVDAQTASGGGALGCNFTQSQVKQALGLQTVTVGTPLGPTQDSSSGEWVIYEVTSQTVEPLSAVTSVIRQELLQATANVNRVSKQIVRYARTADVYVNPTYGTWKGLAVVPPVGPPAEYLLAALPGGTASSGASLNLGGTGTSTGTAATGTGATSGG
jgi:hypothetical protein